MSAKVFLATGLAMLLASCGSETMWEMLLGKRFTIASSSMEPTLAPDTELSAEKVVPGALMRGDIVVLSKGDANWVSRIVGMPGDQLAMADGRLILNGTPIVYQDGGIYDVATGHSARNAQVLIEELPGASSPHRVLDLDRTAQDNFAELLVPQGHYFMLGDNRDNSIDSRMSPPMGLGMVRAEQIEWRVVID